MLAGHWRWLLRVGRRVTGQERIAAAAAEHGWQPRQRMGGLVVEYRKGREYIEVYYTVAGAVREATTRTRRFIGRGKASQITETMRSQS